MRVSTQELNLPLGGVEESVQNNELPAQKNWFYRILRHPYCMPYNRLAVMVTLINLWVFLSAEVTLGLVNFMVLANFAVALLIRQHYVVNALFIIATSVPKHWPISIR